MKTVAIQMTLGLLILSVAGTSAAAARADRLPRPGDAEASVARVPQLVRCLRDDDFTVRRAAARGLGRIGPAAKGAIPVLMCALRDPDPSVRSAAAAALVRIDPSRREPTEEFIASLR